MILLPLGEKVGRDSGSDEGYAKHGARWMKSSELIQPPHPSRSASHPSSSRDARLLHPRGEKDE